MTKQQADDAVVATGLRGHRTLDPKRSATRRREILRAAARVFAERGYYACTVEDIARAIGVSKGVIYYYFRSKDEICTEVVSAAIEGAIQRLEAVVAMGGTSAEMLRRAVAVHVEYNINDQEEGYYAMLVVHDVKALSPQSIRKVRELQRAYGRAFASIVRRGIEDGSLLDRDIGVTTLTILTSANYVTDWFRPGGSLRVDEVANHVADQLLDGVLKQPTSASAQAISD